MSRVEVTQSFGKIYGKRIVIMGGGAQVGQVALGAITEADRHNIRGERISVDTIPLVGEDSLASAVRAVIRLPRVRLLVLAGSIMGGEISRAVEEVRRKGLYVISLNMAGSVPDVADLVVTDPVQAGVMAVMAIADTAKFDIIRQQKRTILSSRYPPERHGSPVLPVVPAPPALPPTRPYASSLSSAGGLRCSPRFIARRRSARSMSLPRSSVMVQ